MRECAAVHPSMLMHRPATIRHRTSLYEDANRMIMDFLPAVPYAHTKPALAFQASVKGYQTSPVSLEPFAGVSIEE